MYSKYRISNSGDKYNLDIGIPSQQKLTSDKYGEEVRFYCEPTVECQRLKSLDEDRLSSTTETVLVEPHYFNLSFTSLTSEFLSNEKKRKIKSENVQNNNHLLNPVKSKDESKPISQTKLDRLKSLEKKSSKENLRDDRRPVKKERVDARPPSAAINPSLGPSAAMPVLPTAPIPASELPPQSVRYPPKSLSSTNIPAALSSLTPIPLKDLNRPTPSAPTPATVTATGSISIQVPLQGSDGTTIMQTINVPKSVLAGASERPVFLTVTPKNGINKGQKQIVMLTRNASGLAATMRTLPAGGESPSKVMLAQRAPPPPTTTAPPAVAAGGQTTAAVRTAGGGSGVGVIQYGGSPGSKPSANDIKALLSQVKPVPTSELEGKVIVNPASTGGSSSKPVVGLGTSSVQQRGVLLQNSQQQQSTSVTQLQSGVQPGSSGVQPGSSGVQPGSSGVQQGTATKTTVVPRQVLQQLIRPGQVITNSQQIVLQDGKRVILQPSRTGSVDQVPGAARILLTQKGQVLQGAQAQALAGKIINTSQGQFIVGPNGQLLSTRKLIQNHQQTVRYVAISQPSSSASATMPQVSGAQSVAVRSVVQQATSVQNAPVRAVQQGAVQSLGTRFVQDGGPGGGASNNTSILSGVPVSSGIRMVTTSASSDQVTTTVASSTPGRVTVAIPIIHSGASSLQQQILTSGSPVQQQILTSGSSVQQQLMTAGGKAVQLAQVSQVNQVHLAGQLSPVKVNSGILGTASPGGTAVLLNPVSGSSSTTGLTVRTPLPGGGHAIRAQLPPGGQIIRGQLPAGGQMVRGLVPGVSGVVTSQVVSGGVQVRSPASQPAAAVRTIPVTSVVGSPGSTAAGRSPGGSRSTSAFNQMFLNALSNRGLLSQQNGKFVYVGDKNKSPGSGQPASSTATVSIPVSSFDSSLAASPGAMPSPVGAVLNVGGVSGVGGGASSVVVGGGAPPVMSVKPAMDSSAGGDKNIVQVVVSAPNLDSFTASPRLLRMASSLMQNPTIAELINTPCETSDAQNLNNGDINIYGVKTTGSVTTSLCDKASLKPRTFYYRDPRLPASWYVAVDINSTNMTTTNVNYTYYTGKGERLRSPSEVAHYLANKLVLLPSCKNLAPPRPIADIPLLTDLPPTDRVHVKELMLPVVDDCSPVIRQIETEVIHHQQQPVTGKRSASSLANPGEPKKPKIVFF